MSRRHLPGIVGIALGLLAFTGCGEDPGVQQGTVPFNGTTPAGLDAMKNEMQKNMRNKAYLKPDDEAGKPAAASKEAAETKPAAEAKSGAETKPAAETKSATKGE